MDTKVLLLHLEIIAIPRLSALWCSALSSVVYVVSVSYWRMWINVECSHRHKNVKDTKLGKDHRWIMERGRVIAEIDWLKGNWIRMWQPHQPPPTMRYTMQLIASYGTVILGKGDLESFGWPSHQGKDTSKVKPTPHWSRASGEGNTLLQTQNDQR